MWLNSNQLTDLPVSVAILAGTLQFLVLSDNPIPVERRAAIQAVLDPDRVYCIATVDYLAAGREKGLDFVRPGASGIGSYHRPEAWPDGTPNDARWVVIRYFKRQPGVLR